tara:strand:- start:1036 stop:1578 length:543 start_codon:yes stop_codon:yes gene_type:complete
VIEFMDGEYKKFDRSLYEKYDKLGKEYARQFLPRILKLSNPEKYKDVQVRDEGENYGPDLVCHNNGEVVGYFEVEIKNNWSTKQFNFPDLQIPERKAKWANGYKGKAVTYCVLSKPERTGVTKTCIGNMATVKGSLVSKCPTQYVKTKYTQNEKFFKIPLNVVHFHDFAEVIEKEQNGTS